MVKRFNGERIISVLNYRLIFIWMWLFLQTASNTFFSTTVAPPVKGVAADRQCCLNHYFLFFFSGEKMTMIHEKKTIGEFSQSKNNTLIIPSWLIALCMCITWFLSSLFSHRLLCWLHYCIKIHIYIPSQLLVTLNRHASQNNSQTIQRCFCLDCNASDFPLH